VVAPRILSGVEPDLAALVALLAEEQRLPEALIDAVSAAREALAYVMLV
jgi:hypothetical protein